ncbi:MAG: TolB family protein [Planctomycetota bacterium]|jgi:Tol biopolymer transport system component
MMAKQMLLVMIFVVGVFGIFAVWGDEPLQYKGATQLAKEVRNKGWIVYCARSESSGTWDLFLSRPDGSQKRNITNTPEFEEGGPAFSPDSKKLLYRRFKKGTVINHDLWGFQGRLIIADANGANPTVIGRERQYPWASWSPDGKQIACLTKKGIQIVDLVTKKVVRKMPRQGVFQQLFWSPDGKWFCGVANYLGEIWTIARVDANTGKLNPTHKFQSCTPDWFPDSEYIIFSCRPAGQPANKGYGWTQLWMNNGEGTWAKMIYGEDGYHIYSGVLSPDGKYVLFSKCREDGGGSEKSGAPMCIMRFADAPTIGGESKDLRKVHPNTKDGPVLQLTSGWEPCWTYADIGVSK